MSLNLFSIYSDLLPTSYLPTFSSSYFFCLTCNLPNFSASYLLSCSPAQLPIFLTSYRPRRLPLLSPCGLLMPYLPINLFISYPFSLLTASLSSPLHGRQACKPESLQDFISERSNVKGQKSFPGGFCSGHPCFGCTNDVMPVLSQRLGDVETKHLIEINPQGFSCR